MSTYGAACPPGFFGFAADFFLQYRGRPDDVRNAHNAKPHRREPGEAMPAIAEAGNGPCNRTAYGLLDQVVPHRLNQDK